MGTGKMEANPFVIADAGKCIGCKACELACFAVHNRENGVSAAVGTITIPVIPRLYVTKAGRSAAPVQCRHCENAPCAAACPVGAIRQENGTILIDEERCIGCKACALACPFGAIALVKSYSHGREVLQSGLSAHTERGAEPKPRLVASKCDLCQSCAPLHTWAEVAGQTQGGAMEAGAVESRPAGRTLEPGAAEAAASPACVAACPVGALSLVTGKPERTVRPFPDLKAMPF